MTLTLFFLILYAVLLHGTPIEGFVYDRTNEDNTKRHLEDQTSILATKVQLLTDTMANITSLSSSIESKRKDLVIVQNSISEGEKKIDNYNANINELKNKIEENLSQQNAKNKEIQKVSIAISSRKKQMGDKLTSINKKKNDIRNIDVTIKHLEYVIRKARGQAKSKKKKRDGLKKTSETLRLQVTNEEGKYKSDTTSLTNEIKKLANLNNDIKSLNAKKIKIVGEKDNYEKQGQILRSTMNKNKNNMNNWNGDINAKQNELKEQKRIYEFETLNKSKLMNYIDQIQGDLIKLISEVKETENNKIKDLEKENDELKKKNKTGTETLEVFKKQLSDKENEINKLNMLTVQKISDIKADYDLQKQTMNKDHEEEMTKHQTTKQDEIKSLEATIIDKKTNLKKKEEEIVLLQSGLNDNEIVIKSKEDEILDLKEKIKNKETEINQLVNKYNEAMKKNQEKETELNQMVNKYNEAMKKNQEKETEINELTHNYGAAIKKNNENEIQITNLMNNNQEKETEINELTHNYGAAIKKNNENEIQITNLMNNNALKSNKSVVATIIEKKHQQLSDSLTNVEKMRDQNKSIAIRLNNLSSSAPYKSQGSETQTYSGNCGGSGFSFNSNYNSKCDYSSLGTPYQAAYAQ